MHDWSRTATLSEVPEESLQKLHRRYYAYMILKCQLEIKKLEPHFDVESFEKHWAISDMDSITGRVIA